MKDIKNLMTSVKDLDIDYLMKWVKELNLENIYRKTTNE